jgi:hypothetical protein
MQKKADQQGPGGHATTRKRSLAGGPVPASKPRKDRRNPSRKLIDDIDAAREATVESVRAHLVANAGRSVTAILDAHAASRGDDADHAIRLKAAHQLLSRIGLGEESTVKGGPIDDLKAALLDVVEAAKGATK